MKPEDLIDAMDMISQDYVTEARPAAKRHKSSRIMKRDAAGTAEAVTVSRSDTASGKDHTVKKQTAIQRIMTGIAATAACAVFACGGWFIVKQAKQQELEAGSTSMTDSLASGTDSSQTDVQPVFTNFLGGQGEIHVLDNSFSYMNNSADTIMYDDTRWYFRSGSCYAERTADAVTAFSGMPAETTAFLRETRYDGKRFYEIDCSAGVPALYVLNPDGTRSDAPFFVLTADMLPQGCDAGKCSLHSITRMTDDAYLIELGTEGSTFAVVYHTDGTSVQLPAERYYACPVRAEDGSLFVICTGDSKQDGIDRIYPDGTVQEFTRFAGDTNIVNHMAVHGDQLYVLLESCDETGASHTDYAAIDFETHEIHMLNTVDRQTQDPYVLCAISNGQQEFVVKRFVQEHRDALFSTDPQWENQQELYSLGESTELPDEVRSRCNSLQSENSSISFVFSDAHYVMMMISGGQYALYDLETGNVQYFHASDLPAGDVAETGMLHLDESQYTALDPGFTGTNFLGGTGSLYIPKNPETILWYDDNNYYVGYSVLPKDGSQPKVLSPDAENPLERAKIEGHICCDGERLYVAENGVLDLLDSSGSRTPFLRLKDAGVSENARVNRVRRVGDAFFICGSSISDYFDNEADQRAFYIWTDRDGKVLGSQTDLYRYTQFFFASSDADDGSCKYAYCWNGFQLFDGLYRIAAPGSGEPQKEIVIPDYPEGDQLLSGGIDFIMDDKIFYSDQNNNYCCYDPDANEKRVIFAADTKETTKGRNHFCFLNGKLYYTLPVLTGGEPVRTEVMAYDPGTGEKEAVLSFDVSAVDQNTIVNAWDSRNLVINCPGYLMIYDTETEMLLRYTME